MSQVSDIMWYLCFSDSSSSEIISWLWVETLHTDTLSVSLSSSLSNPRTTHVHKDNVCKGDCGVLWGGGFSAWKGGPPCFLDTQMNTKYVKQRLPSSSMLEWGACPQQSTPNWDAMAQLFLDSKGRHTPSSAVVHRQERTSVRAVIPHHFAAGVDC